MPPVRRQRWLDWIKMQDPTICCLSETHFEDDDTSELKMKGWENMYMPVEHQLEDI